MHTGYLCRRCDISWAVFLYFRFAKIECDVSATYDNDNEILTFRCSIGSVCKEQKQQLEFY